MKREKPSTGACRDRVVQFLQEQDGWTSVFDIAAFTKREFGITRSQGLSDLAVLTRERRVERRQSPSETVKFPGAIEPASEYRVARLAGSPDLTSLRADHQRLLDLVRSQRGELYEAMLITDEEYAAFASDHAAVAWLEWYDEIRAKYAALSTALDKIRDHVLHNAEGRENADVNAILGIIDKHDPRPTQAKGGTT